MQSALSSSYFLGSRESSPAEAAVREVPGWTVLSQGKGEVTVLVAAAHDMVVREWPEPRSDRIF